MRNCSNPSYGDSYESYSSDLEDENDSPQSDSSPSESSASPEDFFPARRELTVLSAFSYKSRYRFFLRLQPGLKKRRTRKKPGIQAWMPGFFPHESLPVRIGFLSASGGSGLCSFPPAAHTAASRRWLAQGAWWQSNGPACNPPAQWRIAPYSDTGKAAARA